MSSIIEDKEIFFSFLIWGGYFKNRSSWVKKYVLLLRIWKVEAWLKLKKRIEREIGLTQLCEGLINEKIRPQLREFYV